MISCCNILGLEYDGSQEELAVQICKGLIDLNTLVPALNPEDAEDENEEVSSEHDDEGDGGGSDEEMRSKSETQANFRAHMTFSMNYKDVEASIRHFSGKNAYPVERWIADFEETAILFKWTELQKVIFAKRSLTGLDKMLVESEGVIKTWKKLKTCIRRRICRQN